MMKLPSLGVGFAILTTALSVSAAIPKKSVPLVPTSIIETRSALAKPLPERLSNIRAQGTEGYRNLVSIMFDTTATMDMRWKAVTAAGRIGGKEAMPELDRALKSKEWFMRNAGLVAMTQLEPKSAVAWARKLLGDKALIVRMAAVDVIRKPRDTASLPLLWEKLESKENFRGKQSLFIRRRIAEVLSTMEKPGRESKFIALLKDQDSTLHPYAIVALERTTKQSFGKATEPVQIKKAQWEKWWRESGNAQSAAM